MVDTFLGSLFHSAVGRERRYKQITLACARSASATLSLPPAHSACALPAHTAQALGCSAGNRLRPALGCMYLPGLSRSGSGTRVVLRGADSVGPAFCALPGSEQLRWSGVWWARSLRLIASPIPAAQFSGCTTGTPSQADVDRPESQEILVSNKACLQFGR